MSPAYNSSVVLYGRTENASNACVYAASCSAPLSPITLFLYGSSVAFYSRTNKDKEHLIFLFPLMRIISLLTLRLELRRFQDHQISKTYHCAHNLLLLELKNAVDLFLIVT